MRLCALADWRRGPQQYGGPLRLLPSGSHASQPLEGETSGSSSKSSRVSSRLSRWKASARARHGAGGVQLPHPGRRRLRRATGGPGRPTGLGRRARRLATAGHHLGNSGGGVLATLLAERHPDRIDGAIPLCGPLGGIGTQFNLTLDFAFAVRTLLAPGSDLELVRITDPDATAARVDEIVQGAVGTPQGRARLALANALANVVPWARALYPRPDDEAGLDLERLAAAPRIGADDGAVGWLAQFTPTGRIRVPVLALHATGDGAAVPEHERRYAQQVRHAE